MGKGPMRADAAAPASARGRTTRVSIALIGTVVVQIFVTVFTVLFTGEGETYGAPLAVGAWRGSMSFFGAEANVDSWPALAANVVATLSIFLALARLGGHALAPVLGALAMFAVVVTMYVALRFGLPFAGVPLPIAKRDPSSVAPNVQLLSLWIDCMAGAVIFAVLARRRLATASR